MGNELALDDADGSSVYEFDVEEDDAVTVAIVSALAAETGCSPREMEPLHTYVDIDALSNLLRSHAVAGPKEGDLTVTFHVERHEVTVKSYGRIHVSETD